MDRESERILHRAKILVVEDDLLYNETLRDFLEELGCIPMVVYDGKSALETCFAQNFDLYLLDINLPVENGLKLLESLREGGDKTPAIFLTSRTDQESLFHGLKIGADDYLRKPVDLRELEMRIVAVLRRYRRIENYQIDGYRIDLSRRIVFRGSEPIHLGRKVFDLLTLLLENEGRVVESEAIYRRLWSVSEEASYGAVRVYIAHLKKLFGSRIENVRGVGYRLCLKEKEGG